MANVTLVPPDRLHRNPKNPRLIFREDELQSLEDSIRLQGILVPLTVYEDARKLVILDGERRWRCALKIGMQKVPVILQPKPDALTNLMMMFAIHHRRQEWDPLPTAMKMKELEELYTRQHGRRPNERELAELGSLTRGEVRRYRKLLAIPEPYQRRLLAELEKPRNEQHLSVDHVLEAFAAASILRRREVLETDREEVRLRDAIISKFESGIIQNTVAPRKLARLSLAVKAGRLEKRKARAVLERIVRDRRYSIDDAYSDSILDIESDNALRSAAEKLRERIDSAIEEGRGVSSESRAALRQLVEAIERIIRARP
jgi:ParB/RepB/Spo0J family partition protein